MKPKVLVVDDERLNTRIVQAMLKEHQFQVDASNSGEDALEKFKQENYGIVLLDIQMPGIDGFECCRQIHKIAPDTPVIMLTGLADNISLEKSFEVGAMDYIRKPIKKTELIARINNIVRIKDAEERISSLNASLLADLNVASRVQAYIVPDWLIKTDDIMLASLYKPSQQVSGDNFDVIPVSETKSVIYIGDISGHGIQAALIMTVVQTVIKMIIEAEKNDLHPARILNNLNSLLQGDFFQSNYLTILLGIVDHEKNTFQYFNAGHPPIIEYNLKNKKCQIADSNGSIPIGWIENFQYDEKDTDEIELDPNKIFFLYTDGIYECQHQKTGENLEVEGFQKVIGAMAGKTSLPCLPYMIEEELLKQDYNLKSDDLTLIAIQREKVKKSTGEFFYKVSPSLQEVANIGKVFEKTVIELTGSERRGAEIELIINEFLNNIIVHGLKEENQAKADIFVKLTIDKDILIESWDKGISWKPDESTATKTHLGIDDLMATSGRGINIIKAMADEFSVGRFNEINYTVIKLKKE